MQEREISFYEKYIKRMLDFVLALTALTMLSPIILLTALLVKVKLGSPVIFCQIRPGKDGQLFRMYKFRSMTDLLAFSELSPKEMGVEEPCKYIPPTEAELDAIMEE